MLRNFLCSAVSCFSSFLGTRLFLSRAEIGNESMPKIIMNNTINLLFFKTAISILIISNHNSLRVLFDKIASVYFI